MAGHLRGNTTQTFTLPAGVYEIYTQGIIQKSNILTVTLTQDETISLNVGIHESLKETILICIATLVAGFINPLMALFLLLIWDCSKIYRRRSLLTPIVLRQNSNERNS